MPWRLAVCGKPWIKGCKQGDGGSTFSQCSSVTPIDLSVSLSLSPSLPLLPIDAIYTISLVCVAWLAYTWPIENLFWLYLIPIPCIAVTLVLKAIWNLTSTILFCIHPGVSNYMTWGQQHWGVVFNHTSLIGNNYIQDTLSRMENRALAACCVWETLNQRVYAGDVYVCIFIRMHMCKAYVCNTMQI